MIFYDLLMVGLVENIAHNSYARSTMESFHVTAISVIQFSTLEHKGTDRGAIVIDTNSDNRNPNCPLLAEYSHVNHVSLP